jgi:hypothetical protein
MLTRYTAAGLALLLLSASAFAQDIIAGMTIPPEEMESVRNHCETLAAAERAEMSEPGETAQGQGDHEENPAAEGGNDNAAGQGNAQGTTALTGADDASPDQTAGTIDLNAVTLEDCVAAGMAANQ